MAVRLLRCKNCRSQNLTEVNRVPGNNLHSYVDYVDYRCHDCNCISAEHPKLNEKGKEARRGGRLW